jgi:hypothetical protein
MHYGAGAHRARFNCNKQLAVAKAVITDAGSGFSESHNFGVGRRIGVGDVSVPSAADDFASVDYDGADRDFVHSKSTLGAAEGFFHPELIRTVAGRWSLVVGHSSNEVILRGPVRNCG